MVEKAPIEPTSPTFASLEYFLQLTLHASTARVHQAWTVSNPLLTVPFDQKCRDIFTVDTWLDVKDPEEIAKKGFGDGLVGVTVGHFGALVQGSDGSTLGMDGEGKKDQSAARLTYRFASAAAAGGTAPSPDYGYERKRKILLCKVGLGSSFMVPAGTSPTTAPPIPAGYSSFVTSKDGLKGLKYTTTHYSGTNPKSYCYEYLVPSDQILPQYIIEYTHDPYTESKSREKQLCDLCEKSRAEVYCPSDKAMLCKDCDLQLHSANKLASRHQRHSINRSLNVWGSCREHPEQTVEFFCSECFLPVCVYCKMVGHHATGSASKHVLVNTVEAYQTIMDESRELDPVLQSRLEYLQTCMKQLSSRAAAVEQHSAHIKSQIDQAYQLALADLKLITEDKLKVLASSKIEVERQAVEIQRAEEFLRYQRENSSRRCEFLANWTRHQAVRNELKNKPVKEYECVDLDIHFEGTMKVEARRDAPEQDYLEPTAPPASWNPPISHPSSPAPSEMGPPIPRTLPAQNFQNAQRSGSIGGLARSIFLQQNKRIIQPAQMPSSPSGPIATAAGGLVGSAASPRKRNDVFGEALLTFDQQHARSLSSLSVDSHN